MRFVMIGDVGGDATYHVGDEAMLAANLAELGRCYPGAHFTIVSADPAATGARFGVEAVPPIGFPSGQHVADDARDRLLDEVIDNGEHVSRGDAVARWQVVEAVVRCDAVVVSGGGNLSATWPEHLYERVALLALAGRFGKRALVLGQTIGPDLGARQRELLGSVLRRADLVGARETASLRFAQVLRVPAEKLTLQLDDAFFIPTTGAPDDPSAGDKAPCIAITLTRAAEPLADVAVQLGRLARETGARLVFVPHARAPDDDHEIGRKLASALAPDVELDLLPVEDAGAARRRVACMEMVISTRYHPLIFAMSAGVPCLGVYADAYTRVKITGALRHGGLESWTLPWVLASEGALLKSARELWQRRDAVRRQIDRHRLRWQRMHREHWQRIESALEGRGDGTTTVSMTESIDPDPDAHPTAPWSHRSGALRAESERVAQEMLNVMEERDEAVRYALSLRAALDAERKETVALRGLLRAQSDETKRR